MLCDVCKYPLSAENDIVLDCDYCKKINCGDRWCSSDIDGCKIICSKCYKLKIDK